MKHSPESSRTYTAEYLMDLLEQIAKGHSLARHPNTPIHLLFKLAKTDPCGVVENPSCPADLLVKLKDSPLFPKIAISLARNPNLPVTIAEDLSNHSNSDVRSTLASNLNLPATLFDQLGRDSCLEVRIAVASNPRIPISTYFEILKNESPASHVVTRYLPRFTSLLQQPESFWDEKVCSNQISYKTVKKAYTVVCAHLALRRKKFEKLYFSLKQVDPPEEDFKRFLTLIAKLTMKHTKMDSAPS